MPLFDIANDPTETTNQAEAEAKRVADMLEKRREAARRGRDAVAQ